MTILDITMKNHNKIRIINHWFTGVVKVNGTEKTVVLFWREFPFMSNGVSQIKGVPKVATSRIIVLHCMENSVLPYFGATFRVWLTSYILAMKVVVNALSLVFQFFQPSFTHLWWNLKFAHASLTLSIMVLKCEQKASRPYYYTTNWIVIW